MLADDNPLSPEYHDHPLIGVGKSLGDYHIDLNWILIDSADVKPPRLERAGTHGDLFRK